MQISEGSEAEGEHVLEDEILAEKLSFAGSVPVEYDEQI